jgi:hypothetical protein
MSVTAMKPKNAVESLREIVQDLLVPELKAVKTSIDSLRSEMNTSFDSVRTEIRLRDEKQTEATKHLAEMMKHLSDRLDHTLDIRERLASLEARKNR